MGRQESGVSENKGTEGAHSTRGTAGTEEKRLVQKCLLSPLCEYTKLKDKTRGRSPRVHTAAVSEQGGNASTII